MIPEQVWDTDDIPERGLRLGRPTGSAMPLVWAHSEYVKLCRSLMDGKVFDMPPQTVQRYIVDKVGSRFAPWRYNNKCQVMPAGMILRLEVQDAADVHWSIDDWETERVTKHDRLRHRSAYCRPGHGGPAGVHDNQFQVPLEEG